MSNKCFKIYLKKNENHWNMNVRCMEYLKIFFILWYFKLKYRIMNTFFIQNIKVLDITRIQHLVKVTINGMGLLLTCLRQLQQTIFTIQNILMYNQIIFLPLSVCLSVSLTHSLYINPPKVTHEPITRIISKQLHIKLGPFTLEELDSVFKKTKNRKTAGLDEIPPKVSKTREFDDILLRHCNAVYNQIWLTDGWRDTSYLSPKKQGDLRLAKNCIGITLTSIAAKIYNVLLRNHIEPKIDNILRKNQNGFRRNRSTTSQTLTIRRISEGVQGKNPQTTIQLTDFTKAFDSIHRRKMEQILLAYG